MTSRFGPACLLGWLLTLPCAAFAASDDAVKNPDENGAPALMVLRDSPCVEDYAAELEKVGIAVNVSQFADLGAVAGFVGLPPGVAPSHILMANGYVFAGHVGPAVVAGILRSRPGGSGLIGSSMCPVGIDHAWLHEQPSVPFDPR